MNVEKRRMEIQLVYYGSFGVLFGKKESETLVKIHTHTANSSHVPLIGIHCHKVISFYGVNTSTTMFFFFVSFLNFKWEFPVLLRVSKRDTVRGETFSTSLDYNLVFFVHNHHHNKSNWCWKHCFFFLSIFSSSTASNKGSSRHSSNNIIIFLNCQNCKNRRKKTLFIYLAGLSMFAGEGVISVYAVLCQLV